MATLVKILAAVAVAGLGLYFWQKKSGGRFRMPDLSISTGRTRVRIKPRRRHAGGRKRSMTRISHNGKRVAVRAAVSRR